MPRSRQKLTAQEEERPLTEAEEERLAVIQGREEERKILDEAHRNDELEHDSTHWPKKIVVEFTSLPMCKTLDDRIAKLRPKPAETTKKINALIKQEHDAQDKDPWGLQKLSSRRTEQIQHLREQREYEEKQLQRAERERADYEAAWIMFRHSETPILVGEMKKKIADMTKRLDEAVQSKDYEKAANLQRNIEFENQILDATVEDFKKLSGLPEVPSAEKAKKASK